MKISEPPPLPLLCSSILFLLMSSCSLANGRVAPSSPGPSSVAARIPAAAAAANWTTTSFSPAVPAPPPVVIIVERHHHFHRELVIATVLASIATVMIILSTFYAWILWRRSRRIPDGKGSRTSDTARGITLVPILSKFNSMKMSKKGLVATFEYPSLEAAMIMTVAMEASTVAMTSSRWKWWCLSTMITATHKAAQGVGITHLGIFKKYYLLTREDEQLQLLLRLEKSNPWNGPELLKFEGFDDSKV